MFDLIPALSAVSAVLPMDINVDPNDSGLPVLVSSARSSARS